MGPRPPRRTTCRGGFLAVALLGVLAGRVARAESARTSPGLDLSPCSTPQLSDDLERVASEALRHRDGLHLRLESPRPGLISIQLLGAQQTRESTFALTPSDCRELPRMVALLLRSWLSEESWLQSPEQLAPSLAPPEPAPTITAPAAAPRRAGNLGVVAQAGGFFAPRGIGSGPWFAASLERRLTPTWGVAGGVSYEGAVHRAVSEGSLAIDTVTIAARARATLKRDGDAVLDVLFGPGLRMLNARASGFERNPSQSLFDPVLSLSARLQQRVAGRVSAVAGLGLELCAARDVLRISRPGAVVVIEPVRFNLAAGLAIPLE